MRRPARCSAAKRYKRELAANPGAIFAGVLSAQQVNEQCYALRYRWRERIFTPLVTLWTFLAQVLEADSSCRKAVTRVLSYLPQSAGLDASHDPSAYSKARKRLPHELVPRLARMVGEKLAAKTEPRRLWHGHRVKLLDGSSVALWDSRPNQAAYPQPEGQRPGCGFPVARLVCIFDLLTGAVLELAEGPLSVGETVLFHQLWETLRPGDVLVADRYYASYAEIALLRLRGVEIVFRLHQRRYCDFREGRRLGPQDRLLEWEKQAPGRWMSAAQFAALAQSQTVRLVRIRCEVAGWRTEQITLVTTLLDARQYPARALCDLYCQRWQAETNLDHLKTTMQMEFLRTRTPEMIRKELWAHVLAYNLIRTLMWEAGQERRRDPMRISFKATIQETLALWPFTPASARQRELSAFYEALLKAIGFHIVPKRPHRSEPRVRKRRPKNYRLMTKPRRQYINGPLLQGG